ncbi:MAG: hypothetical protein EXS05_14790 [Planctomycetaceae bacterium]|nr:hypothetical protein [Planctomycetaceae bacterium]
MKKHPLPKTPAEWMHEIVVAMADAREAKPFGKLVGQRITEADLYHLAPHVCLKFRGRKPTGKEANRVVKTALANFIANSDPEGIDHDLEHRPFMAFALCYIASHLCLDLIDERKAEAVLIYCEEHLGNE